MGGIRRPFHVRAKKGSDFWYGDFTIAGERFRPILSIRKADDPNKGKATQAAGTLWLEECARKGIRAAAPSEVDTETLIVRYVETELAAKARKRGPRYAQIETLRLNLHVLPKFPIITQITPAAWDIHVEELHGSLKLDTIRKVTISCRLFLRWCAKIGALALVPGLRSPSGEECALEVADRRAFTREERDRFLSALGATRARRVYTVLLYSALRKSALERMLPRWIDWQTGYVTFPASAMKKRKSKSFYLHPLARKAIKEEMEARHGEDMREAVRGTRLPESRPPSGWPEAVPTVRRDGQRRGAALDALQAVQEPAVVAKPAAVTRLDRPVFGPFDYDGHNGHARSGVFWTACKKAGIPLEGLTAHHVTRHTAATIAGNDGASLAELMRLGGWDSPAAALRYLHANDEQARKAVERL